MHTGHLWKKIHSSYDKMTIWPIMLLLQLHKALSISSQESSQNFHRLGYKKQGSPFSAVQGPRNMTDQIAVSSDNQEQIWIYHIWRIYLYGKGGTRGTFAISSYQVLELLVVLLIILYNLPGRTNCSPPRRPRAGDTGGNPSAASATLSSSPPAADAAPRTRASRDGAASQPDGARLRVDGGRPRGARLRRGVETVDPAPLRGSASRVDPAIHAGSGPGGGALAAGGVVGRRTRGPRLVAAAARGRACRGCSGDGEATVARRWRMARRAAGGRRIAEAAAAIGERRPAHMEALAEAGVRGGVVAPQRRLGRCGGAASARGEGGYKRADRRW